MTFTKYSMAYSVATIALLATIPFSHAIARDFGDYGKVTADLRLRYENVEEDAIARNGIAKTARLRLGYETPQWNDFYGFVEGETVRRMGADRFNDGLNGKTSYARISDPDITALNQLYGDYSVDKMLHIRLGRQPLSFDNQRFVAWSKSRQNDTTHDAGLIDYNLTPDIKLSYAHSLALNRYSADRSTAGRYGGNIDLVNIRYNTPYEIVVSGYSYWLDFNGVFSERQLSSQTQGLRLTWVSKGDGWQPLANLEFATQQDYGDTTLSYHENYYLAEGGVQKQGLRGVLSVEQLSGNGTAALQTPLGSSHNFTGYAEKFSPTPLDGLRDYRATVTLPYALPIDDQSIELVGQYHYFTDDTGDTIYGQETDFNLIYKVNQNNDISLKLAKYNADNFSSDTTKYFLTYEYRF